tara:strand:- start:45223 stop:45831 length:609 start_codon:yes stop_codon:yes gene_type:complete
LSINTNSWNRIRYTIYRPFYDIIASYFRPFRKRSIDSLEIKPTDKVLILGAGTGLDLEFLNGHEHIYAIDITPSMIDKLEKEAQFLGLEVETRVMDGSNLDFEDESFDVVILHLIIAVIPDPINCLKETERVLKSGGKFTIMDKFIKPGSKPSFLRVLLNPITNLLATNINRDIDELISETALVKESDQSLNSIFRLIKGSK